MVLKHIEYLLTVLKTDVFETDSQKFYIGGNEPTYLKNIKIRVLRLLANDRNIADIVNELAEYLFEDNISQEASRGLT